MMDPTLTEWFEMDDAERSVVLDELIERMPPGYIDFRTTGLALASLGSLPRFLHVESNVLFNVLFRGPMVMGMTDRRVERLVALSTPPPNPLVQFGADLQANSPPVAVRIETCLVADDVLLYATYKEFGIPDDALSRDTVDVEFIPRALQGLASRGWRAPSEAEWEYALRAIEDDPDDTAPRQPRRRLRHTLLSRMATRHELCRDDWAPTLHGYPQAGSRGAGHGVVRCEGAFWPDDGVDRPWTFLQSVVPRRRPLDGAVAIRPWVELPK